MNIIDQFISAELKYKDLLEGFFSCVYDENILPSHGINHHRRVWSYSKQLIKVLTDSQILKDTDLPLKLLIASYLHDVGMIKDQSIRHGHLSRDFCIEFLEKNNLDPKKFTDVTYAIENHDNKEYIRKAANHDLLDILSVADDLDAFGFIGIYRYSEIYLKRKINPEMIGPMIRKNAAGRFENFIRIFGFSYELVKIQKERYTILDSFFAEFENQLPGYHFGTNNPLGYCGVVDILISLPDSTLYYRFSNILQIYSKDPVISWFFRSLTAELSQFPEHNAVIPPGI